MKTQDYSVLATSIESVDLAALLIALDFPMMDATVINGINVDSNEKVNSTMSWKFGSRSSDGKYTIDKIRREWELPKEYTLDVCKLSRLLAHNVGVLKHVSKRPQALVWNDFGGIGMLSDEPRSATYKELPISNSGFGGTCDTSTMALAITLGVIPLSMYISLGRLYMTFSRSDGQLDLNTVQKLMKDPSMRKEGVKNALAVLVCQLDNRAEILANMSMMKQKVRLVSDGGATQVMFTKGALSERDKKKIMDYMG